MIQYAITAARTPETVFSRNCHIGATSFRELALWELYNFMLPSARTKCA